MAKPARRSQKERRLDMRRLLVEATIACLYRVGYSAVSISMIAKEAAVSRGIISYHFQTKTDLMVAVREAVYVAEREALEAIREEIGTRAYLERLPQLTFAGMQKEPAIAVNEILLASRAEPELGEKLRKMEAAVEERALDLLRDLYSEVGLEPPRDFTIGARVAVATFRGLAIAGLVQGEDAEVDKCMELFSRLISSAPADILPHPKK